MHHPVEELLGSIGIFFSILIDESPQRLDDFIKNSTTLCYDGSAEHIDLEFDLLIAGAQQPLRTGFTDWTSNRSDV